ncbi:SUMF1/EgtB/PvdO family nonheme iron enzyme [uncultured Lamprocystis sp.]|uniref:SUMF1/EgtB/PvdO family nonheme iron enzyme n=2 Tax=uncultured Lamprocystis sp. TaxID=543132 RepID=UPI0025D18C7D|nr:SUMF1/EgtB/PvdO family nonheme iron enzyme [uncultured Lamprocystis sp.]
MAGWASPGSTQSYALTQAPDLIAMPSHVSLSGLVHNPPVLLSVLMCAGVGGAVIPTRADPGAVGVAPAVWPAPLYNPKPLPDDVIVPLPCGGALAFRPVATPAGSTRTALVGPFSGTGGTAGQHLLVGKYEVTALQYLTVTAQAAGGACPPAPALTGAAAVTAQVGVSRIDAINFAAQLSRWLAANADRIPPCAADATPCLPRVEGKPAFVRLPLDLEWEYAARGGALVSAEVFARSRYPMPEGLDRHAWYNRNADGTIAPIGLRLPNPLGLHDLYGNAWECMNDPYRSEQYPGQVGGDVLRGGGIHSTDEDLRADRQVEVQPYDAAGDVRTADTGFRVVLAAPVMTSMAKRAVPAAVDGAADEPDTRDATAREPATPTAAVAAAGRLRVSVDLDSSAFIHVDGEIKGLASGGRPVEVSGLSPGPHLVAVRARGYPDAEEWVTVSGAAPVEVSLHLEPTPERAEESLGLKQADRQSIVDQLGELGYLGRLNQGKFEADFRRILKAFQRDHQLPATGYLTTATLALIERQVAARKQRQQTAGAGVTPPPSSGRYLQVPERQTDGGMNWTDTVPP